MNRPDSNGSNYEKHAPRVSQVTAAVAKVSCKHGLWLVARVNENSPHQADCQFILTILLLFEITRSGWHLPITRGCRSFLDPLYLHCSE